MPIRLHEEDPVLLSEAIGFTSAETGFIPRLIEKDYFCSVLLEYLAASGTGHDVQGWHPRRAPAMLRPIPCWFVLTFSTIGSAPLTVTDSCTAEIPIVTS